MPPFTAIYICINQNINSLYSAPIDPDERDAHTM